MKRILSMVLILVTLWSLLVPAALADQPDPIPVIDAKNLTPTPKGIHHYMLICIDSWAPNMNVLEGIYTDGLILVTVDEYAQRIMLTSFIRDMLIQRPDGDFGRINNFLSQNGWAHDHGKNYVEGLNALIATINTHFDLNIEKFIVVDFKQVENIVNAVGGVEISITNKECNRLKSFGLSAAATSPRLSGAGTYRLFGYAAVLYMRIRKSETEAYRHADGAVYSDKQDYGRTYRDYKVLSSIADSLKDITYDEALKLLDAVIANTLYTNMTTSDMMDAVDLAMQLRGKTVEHIRMPVDNPSKQKENGEWYQVSPTIENYRKGGYSFCEFAFDGMATKQINFELNRQALKDFMYNSFIVVEDEE